MISTRGQTLFELVIALAIGVVIVTAIVRVVTVSVKNSTFAKNKTQATRIGAEAMEWLRQQRDADWNTFLLKSDKTWCLMDLNWSLQGNCSGTQTVAGSPLFRREAQLTTRLIDNILSIETVVAVSWNEGGIAHSTSISSRLTPWQQ